MTEAAGPRDIARRVALAGHAGDAATVRDHLASSDPRVREVALGALERAGNLEGADLQRALADPDSRVRRRAAELAASVPGDNPPSLVAALSDAASAVVEAAAWACGERVPPEPSIVERLAEVATTHDDALCREAAVAALGSLQSQVSQGEQVPWSSPDAQAALHAVLSATKDRPAVRRRAVLALAAFSGPEVDEALERARQDRDWQVRQAVSDVAPEARRPEA